MRLIEYCDVSGKSPFAVWFAALDAQAAAKVTVALERVRSGYSANLKPVGAGVTEYRLDYGPGYRIYFGRDGALLVVLLCGGTKRKQPTDIAAAQQYWRDYKKRKRG